MDDVVYINAEEGINRVMNNVKLYTSLLGKFINDPNMNNFENAAAKGDMEEARGCIHSLKGLAANLSLLELNKQAADIELQIKAGEIKSGQLESLKDVYDKTISEIDKVVNKYV